MFVPIKVISVQYNSNEKKYNNIYGIGIPDILINLVSCHGFSTYNKAITIELLYQYGFILSFKRFYDYFI